MVHHVRSGTTTITSTGSKKSCRPKKQVTVHEEKKKNNKRQKPVRTSREVEQLRQMGRRLDISEEVRAKFTALGGTDPELVITKYLYFTDTSVHHRRFNLPPQQLEVEREKDSKFLTKAEWGKLMGSEEGMRVGLVGPMCSEPTQMTLKRWKMKSGFVLVLTSSGWANFLTKYDREHPGVLKEGKAVQVWACRCNHGRDVLLALVVVDEASQCKQCQVDLGANFPATNLHEDVAVSSRAAKDKSIAAMSFLMQNFSVSFRLKSRKGIPRRSPLF